MNYTHAQVCAAGRRISTWLPNGAGIEGRIYWGQQQIAFRAQNGETYFDQKDILGTERLRMNYAAVSAANYVSLPFGDDYTAHVSGTYGDQDNSHFAQLDRDAESYTDHAQFRQYGNAQGRWMSPDPYNGSYDSSNPQSMNRYVYAMNNPLKYTDPTGLDTSDCGLITYSENGMIPCPVDPGGSGGWGGGYPGEGGYGGGGGGGNRPGGGGGGGGGSPSNPGSPQYPINAMAVLPGPPKSCSDQLADMINDINSVRGSSASGLKGLAQRFSQILRGGYADPGHITQFQQRQTNLQSKIDNYRNSGCGEPPPSVTAWANMPVASPWTPPNLQNFSVPSWVGPAAVTGATACAIFVPGCLEVEAGAALVF